MPRMRILNADEQACYDNPPVFSSTDRKRFFNFSYLVGIYPKCRLKPRIIAINLSGNLAMIANRYNYW